MAFTTWIKNTFREVTGTQTIFRRKFQPLIGQCGLTVQDDDTSGLTATFRSGGEVRWIIVTCSDDVAVDLRLLGTTRFLPGGVSQDVYEFIEKANQQLDRAYLKLSSSSARLYLCTEIHIDYLTPEFFSITLGQMVPLMKCLDAELRRMGYGH